VNGRAILMLVTLAWIAGCDKKKPSLGDYDQSCEAVIDCAPVYVGPVGCCGTPCPNGAVRATVVERARNDVEATRDCKVQPPCFPPATGGGCPDDRVLCDRGKCELQTLSQDAATSD
jgi:hypothetical protein